MSGLGFVHACEQNHLSLSLVGGGAVVQLAAGKVVTNPLDPLWVYNYAFGVRRAFDLEAARAAFLAAGRSYVHVLASPSSGPGLPEELAGLGFGERERQSYRRAAGTGSGAPGLLELPRGDAEPFLAAWRSSWGDGAGGREEAVRRRIADLRCRAFTSADGRAGFLLFRAGPTTQLVHLGVDSALAGKGIGRRLLELAPGLVPPGRPLWLFSQRDGAGDRCAGAAGWEPSHAATDWLLDLPPEG